MNGITSTAPIRGCPPVVRSACRSIATATRAPAIALDRTASAIAEDGRVETMVVGVGLRVDHARARHLERRADRVDHVRAAPLREVRDDAEQRLAHRASIRGLRAGAALRFGRSGATGLLRAGPGSPAGRPSPSTADLELLAVVGNVGVEDREPDRPQARARRRRGDDPDLAAVLRDRGAVVRRASPSIRSVLNRFGGFAPRAASASAPTLSVSVLMNRSIDRSHGLVWLGS